MRRFLLSVFVSCTALSAAFSLWPAQLGRLLDSFGRDAVVNRGLAVLVVAGMTVALLALRVRLWRSERDLARIRHDLAQPPVVPYPPASWGPAAPWGSRPLR